MLMENLNYFLQSTVYGLHLHLAVLVVQVWEGRQAGESVWHHAGSGILCSG